MALSQAQKIKLIQDQIDDVRDGEPSNLSLWREKTDVVLRNVLGETNSSYQAFRKVQYRPAVYSTGSHKSVFDNARKRGVQQAVALLEAAKFEVELSGGAPQPSNGAPPSAGTSIFVVHGRDNERKHEVARTVQKLTKTEPLILHEQANAGATILEKFEQYASSAAYAVAIATGDDVGRAVTDADEKPRARQNVILELGFFYGALGRKKVALLYEGGVEILSDIQGIAYIELDEAGAWKTTLARELSAAGVGVAWDALANI